MFSPGVPGQHSSHYNSSMYHLDPLTSHRKFIPSQVVASRILVCVCVCVVRGRLVEGTSHSSPGSSHLKSRNDILISLPDYTLWRPSPSAHTSSGLGDIPMGGSQNSVLGLHAHLRPRLSLYFPTEKGSVKKYPCGHLSAKCILCLLLRAASS